MATPTAPRKATPRKRAPRTNPELAVRRAEKEATTALPVLTIDDRCEACRWTLYAGFTGSVYCVNERCPEYHYVH